MTCDHDYAFNQYCGDFVCTKCSHHKSRAKCFCGWSATQKIDDMKWLRPDLYY